jgi:hypothetical protein
MKAWMLLETPKEIHIYHKIMIIILHLLFMSFKNHGVHLKCSSLAEHCAQRRRLKGVNDVNSKTYSVISEKVVSA